MLLLQSLSRHIESRFTSPGLGTDRTARTNRGLLPQQRISFALQSIAVRRTCVLSAQAIRCLCDSPSIDLIVEGTHENPIIVNGGHHEPMAMNTASALPLIQPLDLLKTLRLSRVRQDSA